MLNIYIFRLTVLIVLLVAGIPSWAQSADSLSINEPHSARLQTDSVSKNLALDEVVVTSREGRRATSTSIIDRKAIEHLQPSTFSDLLALLPGGSSSIPSLTSANTIHLRQAGTGNSDYDISSLGTIFITDGIPMSTNANMQRVRQASSAINGDPDATRNHVNAGVDMREIPTDNIESVEIIRGIAPVEYGDLTSGVVLIQRKLRATPYEARFKADTYSKLLYLGKGFERNNLTTVFGIDYLDAKADPRNSLTNYKRLTVSARLEYRWLADNYTLRWRSNTDYTGSFDREKYDPEILKQKDDHYRSNYNHLSMSHSLLLTPSTNKFFKSANLDLAVSYERNSIQQDKSINLSRDIAVSTTLENGEHEGLYLPYQYIANVEVDGRPLNIFTKLKALFESQTGKIHQLVNVGTEWKMDKNYGHGQVYDPSRPISPGTPYRPRDYSRIPAQHQLSLYAQDDISLSTTAGTFRLLAGVRISHLLGLNQRYDISGKPFIDPRFNMQWRLPAISIGRKQLAVDLNGGRGRQTKFPTLTQLYPDMIFNDIVEMNYFHMNPDYRRLHLRTYVINPTNFGIQPARNDKWEIRIGAAIDGYNLSLTYFKESLSTGFRTSTTVVPLSYRDYDETAIDGATLRDKPSLDNVPYIDKTILDIYGQTTNGSRLDKEGIEWQLSTRRYKQIKTRFTINGAWFRTTYTNSEPMFRANTNAIVGGTPVNQLYIGFYDNSNGTVREQLNTNIMADTYIRKLGLAFSLTAEMTWFYTTQNMRENGIPTAYISTDGQIRPYTTDSQNDTYLQWLVNSYASTAFEKQKTPFWAFLNLKVTKDFGKAMKLALFVNRMVDYMPNYKTLSGLTVRRTTKPYFGMEMNVKI